MLARENIDILSIATSDHSHADLASLAIKAGVPMIFCEKPMTTRLQDADALVQAVEQSNTSFTVNHSRRWDPFFRQAYDFIRSGRIGPVRRIIAPGGGPRALVGVPRPPQAIYSFFYIWVNPCMDIDGAG